MMTYKGCRVRREQSMSDRSQTLQYHWVDRNGWMVHSPVLREKYTIFSRVLVHFQIMWAATDTTVSVAAPSATTFYPVIPSVLLTASEIAL